MKHVKKNFLAIAVILIAVLFVGFIACGSPSISSDDGGGGGGTPDTTAPVVISTVPVDIANGVLVNANIKVTFSEAINPATITDSTVKLETGVIPVAVTCARSYSGLIATLDPSDDLISNKTYTLTVTTGVKDLSGNALAVNHVTTFTTAVGPMAVNLGNAGNYVILAKSAISTVPTSAVIGDIGLSPAAASFITGFSLAVDSSGTYSTSSQVTGRVYAADYTEPTPTNLTTAINNMQTAYTDAAGRLLPDFTNVGAGNIGGLILVPGLYNWTTGVTIPTDVILNGGPNDTWIFQIAGTLTMAGGAKVVLSGGAQNKNIFWQTSGAVTINAAAKLEGIVLSQTAVTLGAGAIVNGRLLAQTAVTLNANAVTRP